MSLTVEPRAIRLGKVPRVVQVCVCGAVLIRGTRGEQAFYFWSAPDEPDVALRRVFRSEDKAGVHCAAGAQFNQHVQYLAWVCPGLNPNGLGQHAWFVPPYRKTGEECKKCGAFKDEERHKAEVRERLGLEVQHGA